MSQGFENKCALEAVRVDKWLWAARMFKTRTLASSACSAGHVKVNGDVVKASKKIRVGDELSALTSGGRKILKVLLIADRRGPASFAQTIYEDNTPEEPRELAPPRLERGRGRPTKRDRRALNRIRRRS